MKRRITTVAVVTAVALGAMGGAALAVLTSHSGSSIVSFQAKTQTTSFTTTSTTWVDVQDASITINVPSGTSRMVDATFTAESLCEGPSGGWCSVRIIIVKSGTDELNPAAGNDFAFDAAGGESYQAGAMRRTSNYYSTAGSYTVKVQAMVMSGATSFRLDDWNFTSQLIAP